MFVPKPFENNDRNDLNALIRANPFGLLVGQREGSPFATHLPFLLDGERLLAHVARANPHWKSIDGKTEMLAVFSGPHAYVSPRWYDSDQAVPTWNYAAVHVYGAPRVIEDAGRVRGLLDRLVHEYEEGAWTLDSQDPGFTDRMSRGIVAFEMPIQRIEGKFKLSQNRPEEDRGRVAAELESGASSDGQGVARMMRRLQRGD